MTRRRCTILQFPIERARPPAPPPPKRVRLHWDFNEWYVQEFEGEKRAGFRCFPSLEQAQDEIRRCIAAGYELLPPTDAAVARGAESFGGAA